MIETRRSPSSDSRPGNRDDPAARAEPVRLEPASNLPENEPTSPFPRHPVDRLEESDQSITNWRELDE